MTMDFDPKKDYYALLGLTEEASADDIKKAFKKLAVKHHPDRGGDTAKFQEMNEAYQLLSNEKKRQQYDMYRKGGFSGGFGGMGGGAGGFDFGGVDLGDIMGDLFGGFGGGAGRGRNASQRGEDVQVSLKISFEDAYNGVTKKIQYTRHVVASGVKKETCSTCQGRGVVTQQAQTPFGVMQVQNACRDCGGAGVTYMKDGKRLTNGGLEATKETIEVKVPGGIKDGVYIKFSGKGDEGIGSAGSGDLYVKIHVQQSDDFERKGNDLYVSVDVSLFDLVLGGEVTIDHPEGKMKVKIPKGTQVTNKIKVAGKGFGEKGVFSSKGDMYLSPRLHIPKKLKKKEEKLWKELQELA